jgi:hypothetical protein
MAWAYSDRRLADTVRVRAVDGNQPTARRTQFLGLLVRYAAPTQGVDVTAVSAGRRTALVGAADEAGIAGPQPMTVTDRSRVRSTIDSMAEHDTDPTLRQLANMVRAELVYFPE